MNSTPRLTERSLPELRRLAWLVDVAANRQPVTVRCLTRSLALVWMLRRRGVDADFHIGVGLGADHLEAHAWVEWKGEVLNEPFDGLHATVL
jgi:hypothetical protein